MSLRTRFLLLLLVIILLGGLDALLAPFLVSQGVRRWLEWAGRQEGLVAEIGKIDAPFFGPVKISELHLRSDPKSSREIDIHLLNIAADLNFRARILGRSAPILHSIQTERLTAEIHTARGEENAQELDWRQFARLVPANFRIDQADIDVISPGTTVTCEGLSLIASAVESGKFTTRKLAITSPLLRRTFVDLQGATSWENERLTIAGIPLVRGLDLEALAIDLSRLERRRVGLDLHLDAYGGTLRASFQGRAASKSGLEIAGSASNLSLAQISQAMGFVEPVSGSVRASKFTFRGTPGESLDATASIWMELTGFAWRARRADNIMLGATYYDRRLEVDQLYVRQHKNELTINGEMRWPNERDHWVQLPFRGEVNATIPDLNRFAELFGATTGDFTGALLAKGEIDSLVSPPHGQISFEGKGVTFRGVTLDSLGGGLQLKDSELSLTTLEARHAGDFLRTEGSIALTPEHRFDARLTGAISDLGAYAALLPPEWQKPKIAGGVTFDWRGDGTLAAHSGAVQLSGHGLRLPFDFLRIPLDLTLEGSYSPRDVFFRNFQLATDRISLGGFLMLGSNFVEFQALQLALDDVPRVTGTLFLPLSLDHWRNTGNWVEAIDEAQKFDLDLAVNQLDLAGLTTALGKPFSASGVLNGKLAGFGALAALQIASNWSLENFSGGSPKNRIDLDAHYASGRAEGSATAFFGNSTPIRARVSLPVLLEKSRIAEGKILDSSTDFSCAIDCPALLLETLPRDWRFNGLRGFLSGAVAFSNTLAAPKVTGAAQLFDGFAKLPPPWPEVSNLSADFRFTDSAATIESMQCRIEGMPVSWHGSLTTSFPSFRLRLDPAENDLAVIAAPPSGSDLAALRISGESTHGEKPRLKELMLSGNVSSPAFSLTTVTEMAGDPPLLEQSTSFVRPRIREASPLLLQVVRPNPRSALQLVPSR